MKKAVLIQPPVEDFYITQARTYPLNLLYLASVLLDEGVQASIIDMVNRDRQILTIPAHMAYLKKYYLPWDKSLYALFKHYQRFGFSGEKAEAIIRNTNADLFLIPSNFTAYFDRTVEIAGYVKKHHPDAVVITGGYHASAVPEKVASTGLFDHVITGEGEWGLKNIIHGSTDSIIHSKPDPDFNDRIPARQIVDSEHYIINGKRATCITVGRGCPMKCEFCTIHSVYRHSYRKRDISSVINEIDSCYRKHNIQHFDFEDDNLGGQTLSELLDGILSLELPGCSFSAMNGLPYHTLSGTIIRKMKQAGFTHLDISFATYPSIMQRHTDIKKFEEVALNAKKCSLPVNAYFILGLPGLTFQDNLKIIEFLNTLDVTIGPSVFYTVPGIPYYSDSMDNRLCRSSAMHQLGESTISRDQTAALFRYCRALNFLKKSHKSDFEAQIADTTLKTGLVHVRKHKNSYHFIPVEHNSHFSFNPTV